MGAPCRAPHLKAPSVAIMNSLQYETFTYDVTREKYVAAIPILAFIELIGMPRP
jgi:hypothetical protein